MNRDLKIKWCKMTFNIKSRISLYDRLSAFLSNNIPIYNTLESIKNRYKKNNDIRYIMLEEWLTTMKKGNDFSMAIKEWIPANEYMLISAGEKGKGLVLGLKEASRLSTASAKIKSAIIAGTAMPVVLFTMLLVMLAGFKLYMAPAFENLLPVPQWPEGAQNLYNISNFIVSSTYIIIGTLIGLGILISTTIDKWKGPIRDKFDNLPPWSVYKSYQASAFLISVSSMLQAGISLNDSLKILHKNAAPWTKDHLEQMMLKLRKGTSNFGAALNTGMLDEEVAGDVEDYSKLSSFENAMYSIGEKTITESVIKIATKMEVAKNILLVLVATSVGWIYSTSYGLQTVIADQANNKK